MPIDAGRAALIVARDIHAAAARSIVLEGSCWVGTSGFLLNAVRKSESVFVALDDWIPSGEAK
jgi:hypothetical protein